MTIGLEPPGSRETWVLSTDWCSEVTGNLTEQHGGPGQAWLERLRQEPTLRGSPAKGSRVKAKKPSREEGWAGCWFVIRTSSHQLAPLQTPQTRRGSSCSGIQYANTPSTADSAQFTERLKVLTRREVTVVHDKAAPLQTASSRGHRPGPAPPPHGHHWSGPFAPARSSQLNPRGSQQAENLHSKAGRLRDDKLGVHHLGPAALSRSAALERCWVAAGGSGWGPASLLGQGNTQASSRGRQQTGHTAAWVGGLQTLQ